MSLQLTLNSPIDSQGTLLSALLELLSVTSRVKILELNFEPHLEGPSCYQGGSNLNRGVRPTIRNLNTP